MTPYQGLLFFGILILLLLPAAFFGLRGKNLRVLGAAFTVAAADRVRFAKGTYYAGRVLALAERAVLRLSRGSKMLA